MSVRVIAGSAKGRRLEVPKVEGVRPTTGRMRQILFDILGSDIEGARVIDLYAGSGSLGIEALSRGAASATFVDRDRRVAGTIRTNLATCGFEGEVLPMEVVRALSAIPRDSFDLAFVDPPYETPLGSLVATLEALAPSLSEGATVCIEAPPGFQLPPGFHERRRRRSGSTELVIANN